MRTRLTWGVIALTGLLVVGSANSAFAGGTPEQKCSAAKHKIIGKYVSGILGCLAKAIAKGESVNGDCIAKVATKASGAFAKLDAAGGCATTGDFVAIGGRAIAFIDAVGASLPTTPFPLSCYDGMQNVFETGVDCGGTCIPCP